jgi:hypothetical protein
MKQIEEISCFDQLGLSVRLFHNKIAPNRTLLAFLNCQLQKTIGGCGGKRTKIGKALINPM